MSYERRDGVDYIDGFATRVEMDGGAGHHVFHVCGCVASDANCTDKPCSKCAGKGAHELQVVGSVIACTRKPCTYRTPLDVARVAAMHPIARGQR